MARKPDLVREMMEREQDNFEKNEQKIKDLILKEAEHMQSKIARLEYDVLMLEKTCRRLHDENSWLKLKWYSWALHRKKSQLEYLKQTAPSKKTAEKYLE